MSGRSLWRTIRQVSIGTTLIVLQTLPATTTATSYIRRPTSAASILAERSGEGHPARSEVNEMGFTELKKSSIRVGELK